MKKRKLQLEQLEDKMRSFTSAKKIPLPPIGWLKTTRLSLGMTLKQVANRLSVTKQSVQQLEEREKQGTISLNLLRQTANALDMQLVYGFVPKDGTLEDLIERRARELAKQIVNRTSTTMRLEDQENSKERIKKSIEERTILLKNELPRMLWD
ncbi:mobile mystery protein A [Bernardetia litoralis DSM 6794]|uniref:Mobile mystery protein A n=1 Tax=Bernardetia litoralis (strain ATCC 23117 / DSM 6794 / NBRC 15988 / NCIMB 1366 / Fx l1 / Sio-4) TaxID=880071 RepID=I4AIQ0_BERLS|nr:mobile mystery protein A [Bernardetia litoralis]AFM03835.1 mobile mystery protein A [Bernardetia litoralis DSM 6794]